MEELEFVDGDGGDDVGFDGENRGSGAGMVGTTWVLGAWLVTPMVTWNYLVCVSKTTMPEKEEHYLSHPLDDERTWEILAVVENR